MGHELDRNEYGGAAFVSRVRTAWHRLGTILSDEEMDGLPFRELLRRAGVDFEVVKAPNFAQIETEDGNLLLVSTGDESFSIVRTDRNRVIGTVGSTYAPLQNRDAFAPVERLVDEGLAKLETAGSLRGGKQVWGLVSFDVERIVARAFDETDVPSRRLESFAEEVLPYGLFTNDHTGSARARMKETAVRVVCANTFAMSMGADEIGTSVEVSHTGDVDRNYAVATDLLLKSIAVRYAGAASVASTLKGRILSPAEYKENVLDRTVPIAHLEAKLRKGGEADSSPRTAIALEKALERRSRIETLWTEGKGHAGDGSAWEAFQGFVQYADHEADSRDLGASLADGHLDRLKNRVASSLAALDVPPSS